MADDARQIRAGYTGYAGPDLEISTPMSGIFFNSQGNMATKKNRFGDQ